MKSNLEALLESQMTHLRFPPFEAEYRFHPTRRWRFDFAWPELKLAVEVDGGTWTYGRHSRPLGIEQDCEKYGEAQLLGWTVYRCTGSMVKTGKAFATIKKLIELAAESEGVKL